MTRRLLSAARAFARGERGTVTVEAVLILPIIAWAYMGCTVFFQAFHAESLVTKATYTIADALSRESQVDPAFLDSLYALQATLIEPGAPRRLRVTSIRYFQNGQHEVRWSETRGGPARHTNATLRAMSARLPLMPDGAYAVLTEAWTDHRPFRSGFVDPVTFSESAVTRPRFGTGTRLCWNPVVNGGAGTAVC